MTNSNKVAIALAVLAALGAWTWSSRPGDSPARNPRDDPANLALATPPRVAPAVRTPLPGGPAAAAPALPTLPAAVAARMPDATPIDERVRALTASGDPAHALAAYKLVRECLRLERDKRFMEEDMRVFPDGGNMTFEITSGSSSMAKVQALTTSCASMSGRTRLDHHRLLEAAVDRHVPGALILYIHNGPQGDAGALRTRPDDPMVAAWRDEALKRVDDGVRMGDPEALMTSVFAYGLLGQDATPAQTYALYLATNKVLGAIHRDNGAYSRPTLDSMSGSLGPQQKAEAEQQAERIFQAWKMRKN